MKRSIPAVLSASVAALLMATPISAAEPTPAAGGCQSPILLDAEGAPLKEAFNQAKGSVRLLFVVDPVCPGCLQGASKINKAVLERYAPNPRLSSWMVHVPVIGGKEADTKRTCKLLKEGTVTHYWDPKGHFGGLVSNGVDLKDSKGKWVYAWDVWLVYGPDAEWTGKYPPKPMKFMHQLWALEDSAFDFFDPEKFAAEVGSALKLAETQPNPAGSTK
jgi:hypothetical protein